MNPLRWRKMTWLILIFSGLMLAWAIGGLSGTSCDQYVVASADYEACQLGEGIGKGLAGTMLFVIWFVGFFILSIIWFMTRPTRRMCPVCGTEVKKGLTACKKCGHNFAAAAAISGNAGSQRL